MICNAAGLLRWRMGSVGVTTGFNGFGYRSVDVVIIGSDTFRYRILNDLVRWGPYRFKPWDRVRNGSRWCMFRKARTSGSSGIRHEGSGRVQESSRSVKTRKSPAVTQSSYDHVASPKAPELMPEGCSNHARAHPPVYRLLD